MSRSRAPERAVPTEHLSRESGRYLLELYFASLQTSERVRTGTLGERLDVHPASVTEMVSKLAERGLVDYEKHDGTTLTTAGEALAETLVWRYCVTERFLSDELGAAVDRTTVYRIAFELPVDGLVTLAEIVDVPCLGACPRTERLPSGCPSEV